VIRTWSQPLCVPKPSRFNCIIANLPGALPQHESGCRFTFDFSTVYWNSRLQTEHERLVQQWFEPGQVIADVMAGVGPFAVPAAKKGCFVMGNDLNPESAHWMERNRVDNKVGGLRVIRATEADYSTFRSQRLYGYPTSTAGNSSAPHRSKHGQPPSPLYPNHQPSNARRTRRPERHVKPLPWRRKRSKTMSMTHLRRT
jgi:hypothetical protein